MKSSGPQVSGRPSARPASCVQAQLGGMKKALAPASKQDTRATLTGSWTLYHGPFSLSIRAAGWGKIAPGSSSGKATSGCCDPRKPADFEAENSRVRLRFVGVRHGLAEAGEAAFPPCSMMEHHHREKPLPRPRNPAKPRTKKRDSQRNADHKKALPPGQKKSRLFPLGFTRGRWCPVDTVQRRPNRQVRLPGHSR